MPNPTDVPEVEPFLHEYLKKQGPQATLTLLDQFDQPDQELVGTIRALMSSASSPGLDASDFVLEQLAGCTQAPESTPLVDMPASGLHVVIVTRSFVAYGEVIEPGEVICDGRDWWEGKNLPMNLFREGHVEPVTEPINTLGCGHHRHWATRQALDAHRRRGPLADVEAAQDYGPATDDVLPMASAPRVPKQLKVLHRWRAIWRKVKPEWERAKGYAEMAAWVSKDPNLRVSADVLSDIIKAGEAGCLDG